MIDKIFEALTEQYPEEEAVQPAPVEINFYVHFNLEDLKILSISANPEPAEGQGVAKIDYELGLRFMRGEENHVNWIIGLRNNAYELSPYKKDVFIGNRVDVIPGVKEVRPLDYYTDVKLKLNYETDQVEIYYDGLKIQTAKRPIKLYFTRENDPSHLKCTFTLDVNILNLVTTENNLERWPNPITLKIDDLQDTSIYTVVGEFTASIIDPRAK